MPTTGEELHSILSGFPGTMRSSLQADIEAGHAGELDAIGGAVRRRAAAHGIETPALDEAIARIEARVTGAA